MREIYSCFNNIMTKVLSKRLMTLHSYYFEVTKTGAELQLSKVDQLNIIREKIILYIR